MSDEALRKLNDFSRYPIHDVGVIADRLEGIARRLRSNAGRFKDEGTDPVGVLGDIVSQYMQLIGNTGTYFDNLVRDVEHLRAHRAEDEVKQLESKLNDAFYERDAAIQERDGLQEQLDSQGGAR